MLLSVRLEIVLILTQDRCIVCMECTIGLEMELLGDVAHVESCFDPFEDSANLYVR
jgi:hypothetical protein